MDASAPAVAARDARSRLYLGVRLVPHMCAHPYTTAELEFWNEPHASRLDVTFLMQPFVRPPEAFEGVLVQLHGLPRWGTEEECEDQWPGDGDWFWTWDALEAEWDQWQSKRGRS